jgi:hypothetical protein
MDDTDREQILRIITNGEPTLRVDVPVGPCTHSTINNSLLDICASLICSFADILRCIASLQKSFLPFCKYFLAAFAVKTTEIH